MELDYRAIGKRIKIARIKADLTQEALAEKASLSTMNILVRRNRTSGNLGIRCPEVEITYVIMRVYSRSSLSKPYTSRIDLSCSVSMLVIFIR